MNEKIELLLNNERERVLLYALQMYKQTIQETLIHSAFQRELANYEIRVTNSLLTQVMSTEKRQRIALPTIATKVKNQ